MFLNTYLGHSCKGSFKIINKYIFLHCRSDFLTVATTRPETLFGDVAIAVNPKVNFVFLKPQVQSLLCHAFRS